MSTAYSSVVAPSRAAGDHSVSGASARELFETLPDLSSWQRRLDATSPIVGRVTEVERSERFTARRFRRDFARILLDVVEVESPGHIVEHGERHLQHGEDERLVALQMLAGSCTVATEASRDIEVPVGDLILLSTARPFTMTQSGNIACTFVCFPPAMLGLPVRALSGLTGSWVARRSPMGNILADTLKSASTHLPAFTGSSGQLLANNIVELLRTALLAEVADKPVNSRQLRFAQVATYIDAHLGDPTLSVQSVAQAHFVSVRTLHAIFHSQATTAAAWIRVRRLERAGQMLRDPAMAANSIGDIAQACGFESATYFSSAFRAHFGVSPREWRRVPVTS